MTLDRRELIIGAGAVAAAACLPIALGVAAPAVGETVPRATLTDWHVDDMWGVYSRPSEPIGYGRSHGDGAQHAKLAAVQPADLRFINA